MRRLRARFPQPTWRCDTIKVSNLQETIGSDKKRKCQRFTHQKNIYLLKKSELMMLNAYCDDF
jgi:hypothetical protein